jgi:multidrug efflux pump subunit AcrB
LAKFFVKRTAAAPDRQDSQNDLQNLMAGGSSMKGFMGRIIKTYERVIRLALEHRIWLAAFALALIIVSYFSYKSLGSDLLPPFDEGGFVIDYIMLAGSSRQTTDEVIRRVEQIVSSVPEVESISRRTGLQLGLASVTEVNTGDISVKLKANRSRSTDEVVAEVRAAIEQQEPQLHVEFAHLLQDMIGDLTNAPQPIDIKLFSENPQALAQWAPRVADQIKTIPGLSMY